jgi:hypothetical protein
MRAPLLTAACVTLAGGLLAAAPASAQMAWDTPRMTGPESPTGLGFYWTRSGALPGDSDGLFATWGLPGTDGAVSLRGGVGKGVADENAAFGGVDLRAPIVRHSDTQPLDLEWTGGAGVGVGEYILVSVPVAVSGGRSWTSGSVWLAPYLSVGAVLDYRYGDSDLVPDEEFEVQATAGVGADIAFDVERRFVLQLGMSLGDRQSVAVGFTLGGAR